MEEPVLRDLRPTPELLDFPYMHRKVRRWRGRTASGIEVDVYVANVRVEERDVEAFERLFRELLVEAPVPADPGYRAPRVRGIDSRLVT